MILIHSNLFISRQFGDIPLTHRIGGDSVFYPLIGFFSMMLPATAGAVFREHLSPYLSGGRLLNYSLAPLLKLAAALCILEWVKTLLSFGPRYLFAWDVLPFIGVSLVLIALILQFFGQRTLIGISLFVLVAAPLLQMIVNPWMWTETELSVMLNMDAAASPLPRMLTTLWNLPSSALVFTSERSGHLWPLFPWFALVAGGFLVRDELIRESSSLRRLWFIAALSMVFCGFLAFGLKDYALLADSPFYFTTKIFAARGDVILALLSLFGLLFLAFDFAARRWNMKSSMVYMFSHGILYAYIIHFALAAHLASGFARILRADIAYQVYPLAIFALTFLLLTGVFSLLKTKFVFSLVRRS